MPLIRSPRNLIFQKHYSLSESITYDNANGNYVSIRYIKFVLLFCWISLEWKAITIIIQIDPEPKLYRS